MLSFFKKKLIVVTHNGTFHADDVFACATLSIWADQNNFSLNIIRSRDVEAIRGADIVLDVGMEYDIEKNRFDHHQRDGAGIRQNGIPYASFGLIWKHFGTKICNDDVWRIVENNLVVPIDARDNGINIKFQSGIVDHRTGNAISDFNPTWLEGQTNVDKSFTKALDVAESILKREIAWAESKVEGTRLAREVISKQNEPEILILDKYFECEEEVSKHKKIKLIVAPSDTSNNWSAVSARDDIDDYESNRVNFPESWLGLRDQALAEVSGVSDALFCHKGGWLIKAKSKEGVLEMAKIALQSYPN